VFYTSVFLLHGFWPGGSAVPGVYPADFLDIQEFMGYYLWERGAV
jgi:hypothetical protein